MLRWRKLSSGHHNAQSAVAPSHQDGREAGLPKMRIRVNATAIFRSSITVKEPLVSKNTSLAIHKRVDLGIRQRPNWFSQFIQSENRIVFRKGLLLL